MKFSQVDAVLSKGGVHSLAIEWMLKSGMIISIIGIFIGIICFFVGEYSVAEK